jgi:hypothetical protein
VESCDVVKEMPSSLGGRGAAFATVFCPRCKFDHSIYGRIDHPEVTLDEPENAHVYESLDYPFPPDVASHSRGRIKIGSLIIEKIVMFVTAQFPEELDVRAFAYSGFTEIVLARHGGELLISEQGGIRLHVIRVNTIVDETSWLMPLVEKEAYKAPGVQPRLLLTYVLQNLRAPLGQALFCVVIFID